MEKCSPDTTKFCAKHKIPTPPLSFRTDGQRAKFNDEERSKIRFIISHMRQEFLNSIEIIFDRDMVTLRKIADNKYGRCKDQLAVDQQWFKNDNFIQSYSPILDHKKLAASQALLHVARLPASVSHPSKYSLQPRPKRARDEGENKRNTNGSGSQNPQTATGTNAVASSQSMGFGSSQTQTRSDRAEKRARFDNGDNMEGKDNDVAAHLQRRRGKMREVYSEETNGSSSRLASTSTVVSIPPSPPSVPFTWRPALTPPSSSSSRGPSSSRREPSIATPTSAASTSTRVGHDDAWDEEWWRKFLRRHHFECDVLINASRHAEVHQVHIEHLLHNNSYEYQDIKAWLRSSFKSIHLADSYILILADIIWKEKLTLNFE